MQLAAGPSAPRGQSTEKKHFRTFFCGQSILKEPWFLFASLLGFSKHCCVSSTEHKKTPWCVQERSVRSFHPKGSFANRWHPFPERSTSLYWESHPHWAVLVKGKNCPGVARWWRSLGDAVPTLYSLSGFLPWKLLIRHRYATTSVNTVQGQWWRYGWLSCKTSWHNGLLTLSKWWDGLISSTLHPGVHQYHLIVRLTRIYTSSHPSIHTSIHTYINTPTRPYVHSTRTVQSTYIWIT